MWVFLQTEINSPVVIKQTSSIKKQTSNDDDDLITEVCKTMYVREMSLIEL